METRHPLDDSDLNTLEQFYKSKHMTLGEMLSGSSINGSKTMDSLQKLLEFGLVRRDWEKELESRMDVVYCITKEGRELVDGSI
jgi:predicted transcriptional regulator